MFRTMEDFKQGWEAESKITQSIFDALTDKSLSQSINNDHRTIGRIAWHICETITEMLPHIGLQYELIKPPVPTEAKIISEKYAELSKSLSEQVADWNDEKLLEEDDLYGEKWQKGKTLLILIKHEVHHRGQISVLMRQAGVVVPSIYGPAKEGWVDYKMEPPVI